MSPKAPNVFLVSLLITTSIGACSSQKAVVVESTPPAVVKEKPHDLILLNNAGNTIDLKKTLLEGDVNVLFFYSPGVAECTQMEPSLQKLAKSRRDLIIQRVDIDRAGTKAPDYQSPVAQQFSITKLPNFRIYDQDGDLVTTDTAATDIIKQWMLPKKATKPAH